MNTYDTLDELKRPAAAAALSPRGRFPFEGFS